MALSTEIKTDNLSRALYATDASAYREIPMGVIFPLNEQDIIDVVKYAAQNSFNIIPRAGGTSLAGQVVGNGLVVDISKHLNKILELNVEERWVRVQPGVVLDTLNEILKPHSLFFAPETSTSNRCTIGGMVGNNSCGSHSLVYGSTVDHLLEVRAVLSDGSIAIFKELYSSELEAKKVENSLEGKIYRDISKIINNEHICKLIEKNFPDKSLKRRNSGYALDRLISSNNINLCSIIAGSEGTLAFITEIKVNLVPLPPVNKALVCAHCSNLEESFKANLIALKHNPMAVELMDKIIMDLSKSNLTQKENRFFINGDPEAILIIEFAHNKEEELDRICSDAEKELIGSGLVYNCTTVKGKDISKVWELRRSGLGLLSTMRGDSKPVSVIEDTAVIPEKLPDYLSDVKEMLSKYNLSSVYHAHIGSGELHIRPILNLKLEGDVKLFRKVALESALIVKKYRGSISGEHGDGRLRGEFLKVLFGEEVLDLFKDVKMLFDPNKIFNPGKITDTPLMNTGLRYVPNRQTPKFDTIFDYSKEGGLLQAIEQCNGSGDCRKDSNFSGVMCPSYRATREEINSTRGRANILREFLYYPITKKIFDQNEFYKALDLCLSCKGCKSECPSNVDITKYKAEILQKRYDLKGVPLRARLISSIGEIQKFGSLLPVLYNFIISNKITSSIIKSILRFSQKREMPKLSKTTLEKIVRRELNKGVFFRKIYLFADEFTNYTDVHVGVAFVKLMNSLGYEVVIPKHFFSGRASLSKGLLRKSKKLAEKNVKILSPIINTQTPLIGLEPSAILSFRDEYLELVEENLRENANKLASNVMLYDEFILDQFEKGFIKSDSFTLNEKSIKLHGHCHQKSLASAQKSLRILEIPKNYKAQLIDAGCCGMAGSFGYEKEHYDLSIKIGELKLFPEIKNSTPHTEISSPGTSCRHHIKESTGRKTLHPVEILYQALK